MYFDNFCRLCNSVGKTPSAVAQEIGLAKTTVSRWKSGSKPNRATLLKVADYFGVSPELLLESGDKKELPAETSRQSVNELVREVDDMSDGEIALLLEKVKQIKNLRV